MTSVLPMRLRRVAQTLLAATGAGVDRVVRARERLADEVVGDRIAAAGAAGGGGEDRRDDAAGTVDHRAAGVARAHDAAQRRDPAPDRAAAVRVLGDDLARLAEPPGSHVVGAVEREAEDRGGGAALRVAGDLQGRR